MSDIVDRLRLADYKLTNDAADEIVGLRNQLDAARTGKALLALEAAQDEIAELKAEIARHHRDFERWEDMADKGARRIALCDQLAEALRVAWTAAERSTPFHADDRKWTQEVAKPMTFNALAAYEAACKEEP